MWQYAGFHLEGIFYVWLVLPFGWALACYIFSSYKQEVYRLFRQMHVRMTFLLDDRSAQLHMLTAY